jgi:hypothetical protein
MSSGVILPNATIPNTESKRATSSYFEGFGFITVLPLSNAVCSNIMPRCSTDVLYQRWLIALVKISSEI